MKRIITFLSQIHSLYYFLFFLVLVVLFFYVRQEVLLSDCSRYVIGKYDRSFKIARGCRKASFKYEYLGKTYFLNNCQKIDNLTENDYLFLQMTCVEPHIGEVIWDKKVPLKLINNIPQEGWKELP